MNCTDWNALIGLPNWIRPLTCSHGQLDGAVDGAEDLPAVERRGVAARRMPRSCDSSLRRRRRGRLTNGPSRVPKRGAGRRGAVRACAVGGRHAPRVEQVAVVDPGAVRRARPRRALRRASRNRTTGDGIRQRDAAGRLAQRGRGGERVGVVARVEFVDAERGQGRGDLAAAARRVLLGGAGRVDPAQRGERLARGRRRTRARRRAGPGSLGRTRAGLC